MCSVLVFLPFPRLAPDGTTEQNGFVWCITLSWAHRCSALHSPFHGSIQCSLQRRHSLYKVSKEAQCCASTAQETLLKVMCQQFHGTGSLESNSLPRAHLENEDEKNVCYWKFWVCAVRWIPGRRFICRNNQSQCWSLVLLFISHSLLLLGKQTPLKFSRNWIAFGIHSFLPEILSEILSIFYLLFLLKKPLISVGCNSIPSLTLFTVEKTFLQVVNNEENLQV